MTTASTYFTGPKPMFGPEAFASEATPKCEMPDGGHLMLTFLPNIQRSGWLFEDGDFFSVEIEEAALALCEKAAQGWIRSKGYVLVVQPLGDLSVEKFGDDSKRRSFDPINGSPDWHAAARWVNEQTKEKA